MTIREQIKKGIAKAIKQLTVDSLQLTIDEEEIEVTRASDPRFGDYTTNVALKVFSSVIARSEATKQSKKEIATSSLDSTRNDNKRKGAKFYQSSMDFANILSDSLKVLPYIEKLEVAGPGFINFWIKKQVWQEEVEKVLNRSFPLVIAIRQLAQKQSKKILVEYAHPNTHKLFHIGHLRNITTGESIARLLEAVGHKVTRANYQGDVGLHIAKAIWGFINLGAKEPKNLDEKVELLAQAYRKGNEAYEEGGQKEAIDEINKKLYEKDSEITKLWKETRGWSLQYFERIYKRVGTKFDRLYFEGEVADLGKEEVLKAQKTGIFVESDGAIIFPGDKFGLHKRVFINSAGFATYEGKDVGLVKLQFSEYSPDLIIHVVAPEQTDYFKVLFKALEQVYPKTHGRELHLSYGWVRLKEGKMSSRRGEVVTGEWLLDEAKRKALEILASSEVRKEVDVEEVCEQVAVGAVKYAFLKMGLSQDLVFDLAEAINLNGNSGPYLQYTYARCRSVLGKASKDVILGSEATPESGFWTRFWSSQNKCGQNDSDQEEENLLLRTLGHFEEAVLDAATTYSPNVIANFLYEIAQKYNTLYNNLPILKADETKRSRRLFLTEATADILKKGLYLLGISAPEKM